MLFNSYEFIFFLLPIILAGYFFLLPKTWRHAWLVLTSYVFYGWWDYRYCSLLLLTTGIDYVIGGRIAVARNPVAKKRLLFISVCSDLSILFFFKYYDLGASTIHHLVLPVGISFYTFQAMSYSIDIYRGHAQPARSFIDFACYVSLFPQLVAGPIV